MLAIGDKVEVLDSAFRKNIGKKGKVILVTTGFNSNTQPIDEYGKIPKLTEEPRDTVELDDGTLLHSMREQQLRKINS
jgi:RNase P/RNase MRP subunit p29